MPHDPIEYPLVVNTGASLVGQTDEDGVPSFGIKPNKKVGLKWIEMD